MLAENPMIDILRRLRIVEEKLRKPSNEGPTIGELYGTFRGLPGLRGLWYPGVIDNAGTVYDATGQGRTLTYNGNPFLTYATGNVVPYYSHDGTGDWFSRATEAGLGLVGNEASLSIAYRGCTVFGWFFVRNATTYKFVAKQDGATEAGNNYVLYSNGGTPTFRVSNGAVGYGVGAASAMTANVWYFLAGRYKINSTVDIFVNGKLDGTLGGAPATLNNPAQPFQIGAGNNTNPLNGGWALAGIVGSALPDELISYLMLRSRPFFGV